MTATQTATHTPTPWRIGNAGKAIFGPPTGNPSPETVADLSHTISARANAAHIVKCVNLFPELVSFVKNLRALSDDEDDAEVLAEVRGDYCRKLLASL